MDIFKESDKVAVKIRGLPWKTKHEHITDFFANHGYIEKSIVFGVGHEGKTNGFGAILFKGEQAADLA